MIPTHMPGESDYDFLQRLVRTVTNLTLVSAAIGCYVWTEERYSASVEGTDEWLSKLTCDEFILFWLFVLEAEHQA